MVNTRFLTVVIGITGGFLGLIISSIAYINLKPGIDILAFITPPALAIIPIVYEIGGRTRVDLTPIASTPIAYTLYHITATYLRQPGDIVTLAYRDIITLAYTITLSASITVITIAIIVIVREKVIPGYIR